MDFRMAGCAYDSLACLVFSRPLTELIVTQSAPSTALPCPHRHCGPSPSACCTGGSPIRIPLSQPRPSSFSSRLRPIVEPARTATSRTATA